MEVGAGEFCYFVSKGDPHWICGSESCDGSDSRSQPRAGILLGGCWSVLGQGILGLYQVSRADREKGFWTLFAVRIISGSLALPLVLLIIHELISLGWKNCFV